MTEPQMGRAVQRFEFYRSQIIEAMDASTTPEEGIGRAIGTIAVFLAALDERIHHLEAS